MKTARLFLFFLGLALSLAIGSSLVRSASGSSPVIVQTPSAPHPQARIRFVDFDSGTIRFDWLDAQGKMVDSGNSQTTVPITGDTITAEQKAILAAGITAATSQ